MQTELDLVIELRKGSQEAYKKLHDLLYVSIYYFAARLTGNKFDANDIATEVFLKMWTLRSNFDTYQNLKAFLYLSTRNACLNYLDDQTRKAAHNKKLLQELADREEDLYRPEFLRLEMVRSEMLEYFYKEVKKLPKLTRKIVEMRLKKNMVNAEIAVKMGLSEGTIRNKFSAGLKQLSEKQGLEKKWLELEMLKQH